MNDFARRVVSYALLRQGLPYCWLGKGLLCWSPNGGVPTPLVAGCTEAYDCSGLVTTSILAAGGPDLRMTWKALTFWLEAPLPLGGEQRRLRLFGTNGEVDHIAIELGGDYQVEASGGDRTTTTASIAIKRGAKVRISDISEGRRDFIGYRSLNALQHYRPKGAQ